ncbi:alpha/beta fold hydrolase [Rhodobacter sp. SGA-6-6]|uniref:alpha/beta fold hydrolase n=1 Tax=Rhodobacter sp. SGA-6-6 TaxID=2710882 RepID=UPI0013EBEB16|nr:alpha/beta fold hydrolase [Rhodobacter sp. SGA-6-6]NGM44072.1 alpha/beta fold hydrolase [Rhodobacter sp. SGA-6-6]
MTSPTLPRSETAGIACHMRGEGEPLVLLHGVGMRIEAWGPQLDALSRTHRVIALDLPGHGGSAALPEGSDLPAFVAWLGRALDALGLARVNLAGHSMGALIAGGTVAEFGDRILRVALLNGVRCRTEAARAAVLSRVREIAEGAVPDVEGPLLRWFGDAPEAVGYRDLARDWLAQMDRRSYLTAYRAFATGDRTYADCWPDCRCPALFITGAGDPNSTPAMSLDMAALAPAGKAVIVEGHRHVVNLTAPAAVNAHLSAWLAQPVAGEEGPMENARTGSGR